MTDYEINGQDHKVKYDLDNRIIKVKIDNTDVKYRYDALGRRVIRKQKSFCFTKFKFKLAKRFFLKKIGEER